jgi:C4-dicarboxylate-specific signal transduction histidine kinase
VKGERQEVRSKRQRDEIFIQTTLIQEDGGNFVQLTFQDTGPGIGDDNPDNIFLPFYSTKKGPENNLGLGLSINYNIIQKYYSEISWRDHREKH